MVFPRPPMEASCDAGERDGVEYCGCDILAADKRMEAQLRLSLDDLQRAQAIGRICRWRMERVREEERTRIARELHDELGQMLTAAKTNLYRFIDKTQYFDPKMALDMADVVRMLDGTADAVRRISRELRPPVLDTLDLADAIKHEVVAFRKRMGIRCEYAGPAIEPPMPDMSRVHIYRIFQEALTNISRHARATHVSVNLRLADGMLVLAVEDNGLGIRREALAGGTLGFAGMQERAVLIDGTLAIDTRPDFAGTRLTLRTPLPETPGGSRA